MKKLLLVGSLVLMLGVAGLGHAQSYGPTSGSVVIGQNAAGQNIVLSVITLKFLDPVVAAQLFGSGNVIGSVQPQYGARGGEMVGSVRSSSGGVRPRSWGNQSQGTTGGYGGYDQALRQYSGYQGYQSPYGNR